MVSSEYYQNYKYMVTEEKYKTTKQVCQSLLVHKQFSQQEICFTAHPGDGNVMTNSVSPGVTSEGPFTSFQIKTRAKQNLMLGQ